MNGKTSNIYTSSNYDKRHAEDRSCLDQELQGGHTGFLSITQTQSTKQTINVEFKKLLGAWSAIDHRSKEPHWIYIDLGVPMSVTSLVTKGRWDADQWVTRFTLDSSNDCKRWTPVRHGATFKGNHDRFTISKHDLNIVTRCLRLTIKSFHRHPSLRWGVFACNRKTKTP